MDKIHFDRSAIGISPEKVREAAWELWEEVADGTMPTENSSLDDFDEIVKKIIKVIYQDKGDP